MPIKPINPRSDVIFTPTRRAGCPPRLTSVTRSPPCGPDIGPWIVGKDKPCLDAAEVESSRRTSAMR